MSRGIFLLAGLLAASLIWAYLLVNPFGDGASTSTVPVWKVQPREIARLIYRKGANKIIFEPAWEAGRDKPFIWAQSESKPRPPKQLSKAPAAVAGETKVETFKANAKAEKILRKFSNLEAKRGVGELANLNAEEFGLPSLSHTLRLEFKGGREPLVLELGNSTYGNRMRYASVSGGGRIYLFFENSFSELERGRSVLFDRELFPISPVYADRLSIHVGQKSMDMWRFEGQTNKGIWVYERGDAEGRPELMEFVNVLKNLKVLAYQERGDDPLLEASTPELEVRLYHAAAGEEPASLKLYRRGTGKFVARSSYSRATVRVGSRITRSVLEKGRDLLKNP